MARWMINCKEYAELVSGCMDRPLTFWERLSIRLHGLLCPPCNLVRQQFETIRRACRYADADNADLAGDSICLTEEARARIKAVLNKAAR